MKKILKMTDISYSEVLDELQFIRHLNLINPHVEEINHEIVFSCDINDNNKFVFADVLRTLLPYVYTDNEQTPQERVCDLLEVRNMSIAILEQGTRGFVVSSLLSNSEKIDNLLVFSQTTPLFDDLIKCYGSDDSGVLAKHIKDMTNADIVFVSVSHNEDNLLLSSNCSVSVLVFDQIYTKNYNLIGGKRSVSDQLSFLGLALLAKKIF